MRKLFIIVCFISVSCVTSNNSDSTFRRYLSHEEKKELLNNGEILKIHTSKRRNGQTHWTGPLRVQLKSGNYSFTSQGIWKGYYKTGELLSVAKFDSLGQLEHEKIFGLDGTIHSEIIGYDESSGSDVVRIEKLVSYNPPLYQDTIAVEKFKVKEEKLIRHGVQSYFNEHGQVKKKVLYQDGTKIK